MNQLTVREFEALLLGRGTCDELWDAAYETATPAAVSPSSETPESSEISDDSP